jgi:hypothetical protein
MTACATWSELFGDLGEPVLGDPGDYSAAATEAGAVAEATTMCSEQFALVSAGDAAQLQGASAQAIGWMFGEIDGSLHELPSVFESLVAVLATHRERLDALRAEAASALARAATRWSAVGATAAEAEDAAGALAWVERQLNGARQAAAAGDVTAVARVDTLEGERWYARNRLSAAEAAHQDARDTHESSRAEHAALVDAEAELVRATRDALGDLDLGDLRDPSGWLNALGDFVGAAWDWTGGALVDMVDGVIDAAVALADGRFLDALHHLNDALDGALRLLTTITVAVVAVGTIACPGALVALPALLSIGQGLSAARWRSAARCWPPNTPTPKPAKRWASSKYSVPPSARWCPLGWAEGRQWRRPAGSRRRRSPGPAPARRARTLARRLRWRPCSTPRPADREGSSTRPPGRRCTEQPVNRCSGGPRSRPARTTRRRKWRRRSTISS